MKIELATPGSVPLHHYLFLIVLGPAAQSIVSLTSSLSGQLVKCFTTLSPNTLIFLLKNFALQKLLTFFQQNILAYLSLNV